MLKNRVLVLFGVCPFYAFLMLCRQFVAIIFNAVT